MRDCCSQYFHMRPLEGRVIVRLILQALRVCIYENNKLPVRPVDVRPKHSH